MKKVKYFYNGIELYNVNFNKINKKNYLNWLGHDLQANWKDPKENNKEKLGNFYLKELEIK